MGALELEPPLPDLNIVQKGRQLLKGKGGTGKTETKAIFSYRHFTQFSVLKN